MVNKQILALYYFTDTKNYNLNLRNYFSSFNVELLYENNLSKLLSKILVNHPSIVVLEGVPTNFIAKCCDCFDVNSPFFVPYVCFLCDDEFLDLEDNLPFNCFLCSRRNYSNLFKDKIKTEDLINYSGNKITKFPISRFDLITKALRDLGANVKSSGSIFIKDCINQVLIDGCRACTLYNSVYNIVANKHNTNINNLERCMRTAVNSMWDNHIKNSNCDSNNFAFNSKPTVKEFIFYVSNYIKDLEYEERICCFADGISRKMVN